MLRILRFFGAFVIGISLDQGSKYLAQKSLSYFIPKIIIPNGLSFQLVHNYGAAYGVLQGQRWLLLTMSFLVLLGCLIFRRQLTTSPYSKLGLLFLVIGTVGNFTDRLFRGYVIDFINIHVLPVFNVADMCIDFGVFLFILEVFLVKNGTSRPS